MRPHGRLLVVSLIGLTLCVTLPATADIYKCPDAQGKIQYTNVPCHERSEAILHTPTPSVLPPSRVLPQGDAPALPPAPMVAAPAASISAPASRGMSSNPLDTKAFGLLNLGISEATVRARVGEPDAVVDGGTQVVGRGYGRVNLKEVRLYTWVYYGDSQTLDSHLNFADGKLVSKEKVAR
jgi:hypothetical protein